MRLPTDAALVIAEGAADELVEVWREERLPVVPLTADPAELDAALETLGATTIVICGEGGEAAAAIAAGLGYRVFLVGEGQVGEGQVGEGVRVVSRGLAIAAGRMARARERWKAARG